MITLIYYSMFNISIGLLIGLIIWYICKKPQTEYQDKNSHEIFILIAEGVNINNINYYILKNSENNEYVALTMHELRERFKLVETT